MFCCDKRELPQFALNEVNSPRYEVVFIDLEFVDYWVTVRKTRDIHIRRRRVPLSEVYSSISENFHLMHTNGTGQSCVKVNTSIQYG